MSNRTFQATGQAEFRFYAGLNEFLEPSRKNRWFTYFFRDFPGIKDPVEALGVPHTEVELIIVNGTSVDFDYQLRDADRVAVYPAFFQIDIRPLARIRKPLANPAFVLDVHLGKLARLLRLLGLDAIYSNRFSDRELVNIAEGERRILLTRDRRLLFHRRVEYGHFVRNTSPGAQVKEVVTYYRLQPFLQPFSRCLKCNGQVVPVTREAVLNRLKPRTARYYDEFYRCRRCGQVYWKGPHFRNLVQTLRKLEA